MRFLNQTQQKQTREQWKPLQEPLSAGKSSVFWVRQLTLRNRNNQYWQGLNDHSYCLLQQKVPLNED